MCICVKICKFFTTINEASIISVCNSKNLIGWRQVKYYQMISKLGHNLISVLVVTIQSPKLL